MILMIFNLILATGIGIMIILCAYMGNLLFKKEHFFFIMVVLFAGFILLGNLLEYNIADLGAALSSRKMEYMGACFVEWFFMLFLMEHFGYKRIKLYTFSLFTIHMICFIGVFTTEKTHLFYKTMEYDVVDGVARLATTPGPLNHLHRIMMVYYMIALPFMCIQYYMSNKTSHKRKEALQLSFAAILPSISYLMIIFNVSERFDYTPLLFVVSLGIGYFVVFKGRMFDAVDIARENLISGMEDAIIVMDADLRILYMNEKSKELFPDIDVNQDTYNVVAELCKTTFSHFNTDERKYNLKVSNIYNKKKLAGYTLVFNDVTDLVNYADQLEQKVNDKVSEIEHIQQHVLMSFANMIEMRDGMTGQHVKRTTEYVGVLANALLDRGMYSDYLTAQKVDIISRAAALHDVGKIAISDLILQKPGKLSFEEFEKIKTHSEMGGRIISEVLSEVGENEYLLEARNMALYHHEKWNGEGYPAGLAGENIPISARIMALADVFDALISKRQYKDAFPLDEAFKIIEESAGSHFDPDMARVFVESRPEIEKVVEALKD